MGTKGRDLSLWWAYASVLLMFSTLAMGNRNPFWLWFLIIPSLCFGWFYIYIMPRAKKYSQELGLKVIVLIPINRKLARYLINSRGVIKGGERGAFEVHLDLKIKDQAFTLMKQINNDLLLIEDKLPGYLFLWETTVPVPSMYRKTIKDYSLKGYAYWQEGGWPIPKPPLVGRRTPPNHRTRIGAVHHYVKSGGIEN